MTSKCRTDYNQSFLIKGIQGCIRFWGQGFLPLVDWARQELHLNLTTYAADSHLPQAKNTIRLVKETLRSIQCETLFKKFPRRLTIGMVKRITVLINLFRRKSGVHLVMSPKQILFGKKFKTPLCKIGELVMAYNVTSSNKTTDAKAFFALYIGPNDSGTGNISFKLGTK